MARRKHRRTGRRTAQPETLHPEAAGLDVGATAIYGAVRADRATPAIRNFPTFTSDLHELADWLKECQVTTSPWNRRESTGSRCSQILEARGFEVVLVNARLVRSAPGRKSDVADCEWLRHLHSVGLLRGSFPTARRGVRATHAAAASRHPGEIVIAQRAAYAEVLRSDEHPPAPCDLRSTGVTGMAITDAILDVNGFGTLGRAGPSQDQSQPRHLDQGTGRVTGAPSICSPSSKRGRPMRTTSSSSTPVMSRSRP